LVKLATNIKTGTSQVRSSEVSFGQIGTIQTGFKQFGIKQTNSLQNGTSKIELLHIIPGQVSTTQVNSRQIDIQLDSRKVSLPSSILSEQFLNVHNPSSASINTINNSALSLWNNLIHPQSPFNINLEITNLPTGQLAEAQVTKFDYLVAPSVAQYLSTTMPTALVGTSI